MLERLKELLGQVFEGQIPAEGVTESSRLIEDVGMNSIGLLYMAMAVEEARAGHAPGPLEEHGRASVSASRKPHPKFF